MRCYMVQKTGAAFTGGSWNKSSTIHYNNCLFRNWNCFKTNKYLTQVLWSQSHTAYHANLTIITATTSEYSKLRLALNDSNNAAVVEPLEALNQHELLCNLCLEQIHLLE